MFKRTAVTWAKSSSVYWLTWAFPMYFSIGGCTVHRAETEMSKVCLVPCISTHNQGSNRVFYLIFLRWRDEARTKERAFLSLLWENKAITIIPAHGSLTLKIVKEKNSNYFLHYLCYITLCLPHALFFFVWVSLSLPVWLWTNAIIAPALLPPLLFQTDPRNTRRRSNTRLSTLDNMHP